MRTFIRRSLWDVVPRDQRDSAAAFRRRQVVAAIVVLVGAAVLGWSLRLEPGGNLFYAAAAVLAGVWALGAFFSGRLHLGRMARGSEVFVRPILAPILLGLLLVGVFVLGALVVREIPPLATYVSSGLSSPVSTTRRTGRSKALAKSRSRWSCAGTAITAPVP